MLFVIQIECFFNAGEDTADQMSEAIVDGLENLRQYGGARVVGSYEQEDTDEWRSLALSQLDVPATCSITVDRL